MTRETVLRSRLEAGEPDLIVDLYLYPTDAGGKAVPIELGYGCPCKRAKNASEGWDGYPLLREKMLPGERRTVGFVFLSGKLAVEELDQLDTFFLWEGRVIGEGKIVR